MNGTLPAPRSYLIREDGTVEQVYMCVRDGHGHRGYGFTTLAGEHVERANVRTVQTYEAERALIGESNV